MKLPFINESIFEPYKSLIDKKKKKNPLIYSIDILPHLKKVKMFLFCL